MGLILDSRIVIDAERRHRPIRQVLADIEREVGETPVVISSITVFELEHGYYRAHIPEHAAKRREYLDAVFDMIPVQPFTKEMAPIAARIEADARKSGTPIPLADLLIGVTALYLGYAIGTRNVRHLRMIPNLVVLEL